MIKREYPCDGDASVVYEFVCLVADVRFDGATAHAHTSQLVSQSVSWAYISVERDNKNQQTWKNKQ